MLATARVINASMAGIQDGSLDQISVFTVKRSEGLANCLANSILLPKEELHSREGRYYLIFAQTPSITFICILQV